MSWDDLEQGRGCPFDVPRTEPNEYWDSVVQLSVSTLCLPKNQAYRGQCILIYDPGHITRPDQLEPAEWAKFSDDAHRAVRAVTAVCTPDHINVACLGNTVPHLHWLIIPRYKDDPRWLGPVWTTTREEMHNSVLPEDERVRLIAALRLQLR